MRKTCSLLAMLAVLAGVVPASAQTKLQLKYGMTVSTSDVSYTYSQKFAELVKTYSQGRAEIVIYPSNQLGDDQELTQRIQLGTADLGLVTSNNLVSFSPTMAVFNLPYMFKDASELKRAVTGMWDEINTRVEKEAGLRILGYSEKGFRVIANSKRPIKRLEDLRGLRIRVPKNPLQFDVFKAWGGSPIPVAWGELFPALQQGVVDGIENVYISILSERFFEVVKYATDVHYLLFSSEILVKDQKFRSLDPALQAALVRAGHEASDWGMGAVAAEIERAKKTLADKHGMVLSGPPVDEAEWEKIARGLWPDFYKLVGGGDAAAGRKFVERFDAAKRGR